MKKNILYILVALCIFFIVFMTITYLRFQNDMRSARARVVAGSEIIETASGPIEYAIAGDGLPVLVVHGAGGGYDQGMLITDAWLGDEFQKIALSRFGYLRTPLPADASAVAQADACASLLDTLNIQRIVIMGISAGGPSVLQFALRHPERCSALILIAAVNHEVRQLTTTQKRLFDLIFRSDFIFWLITSYYQSSLYDAFGIPHDIQTTLTRAQKDSISYFLNTMHPIHLRQKGIFNDLIGHTHDYPLENITVPTLIIHAVDDPLVPFTHGEYAAANIPHTQLIPLRGGHLLIGQNAKIRSAVTNFLHRHVRLKSTNEGK